MYLPSLGPISTRKNPPLNPQLIKIDSLFLVRPEFGWSPRFKRPINQKKKRGKKSDQHMTFNFKSDRVSECACWSFCLLIEQPKRRELIDNDIIITGSSIILVRVRGKKTKKSKVVKNACFWSWTTSNSKVITRYRSWLSKLGALFWIYYIIAPGYHHP